MHQTATLFNNKPGLLKIISSVFCLLGLPLLLMASTGPEEPVGFIITKNNRQLTGKIEAIMHTELYSLVTFTNDLGTTYYLSPQLIKGFVFKNKDGQRIQFESKFNKGRWVFLRVLILDEYLKMFQAPGRANALWINLSQQASSLEGADCDEVWLEFRGDNVFRVGRLNFRKKMRNKLLLRQPSMGNKIGKEGYRYRDLEKIVREYNDICKRTKWAS
mgnify:CR=1 FL=1